jgi:hypothetical protein
MRALREARDILQPYWQIEDAVWAQTGAPQLKTVSDQIKIIERTDTTRAKAMLAQYPEILWVRKKVAELRKQMKATNPLMKNALDLFYSY